LCWWPLAGVFSAKAGLMSAQKRASVASVGYLMGQPPLDDLQLAKDHWCCS